MVMKKTMNMIAGLSAAIMLAASCGTTYYFNTEETENVSSKEGKRISNGETYIITEYDRNHYDTVGDLVRERCSSPLRGVSSVNAKTGSRIYMIDGSRGTSSISLAIVYSIKVVDSAFIGSYGFSAS